MTRAKRTRRILVSIRGWSGPDAYEDKRLIGQEAGWTRGWLDKRLVGQEAGWIRGWLDKSLIRQESDWTRVWLDQRLIGQEADRTRGWLDRRLIGQEADWTGGWLSRRLIVQKADWTGGWLSRRLIGQEADITRSRFGKRLKELEACQLDNRHTANEIPWFCSWSSVAEPDPTLTFILFSTNFHKNSCYFYIFNIFYFDFLQLLMKLLQQWTKLF